MKGESVEHRIKWEEAERKLIKILFSHPDLDEEQSLYRNKIEVGLR